MIAPISRIRQPLVHGGKSYHNITEDLVAPTEKAPSLPWILVFIPAVALLMWSFCSLLDHLYWYRYLESKQNN